MTVAAEASAPAPTDGADGGQVDQDNPWPGLPSFREQDQEFFFGREAETETLRRTVMRESTRATVLFGRSGLGKTSLLQAGLFPRLRRQGVLPVAIRLVYAGERGLVEQVRDAILAAAAAARVEAPAFPANETLWESFHRAGANFWSESNRIVVPLLVFDQFEEIFTLGKQDPAGREPFLAELADLVEGRPPEAVKERLDAEPALAAGFSPERHDFKILLSLRQDFLADLDGLRGRMRSLGASRLALLSMNGEAALRVVTQAGGHLIEPKVAEEVVRFVSGAGRQSAAGAGSTGEAARPGDSDRQGETGGPAPLAELEVDPTLLSLVCRELNNRRRERGQPKITCDLLSGSWKEILTRFYENSLEGLAPEVRTFVEERLLTRSGYRDSIAWDNAIAEPGVTAADLLTLRDRRLLRFEERRGTAWIELTHDVLTEVIGESRELRRQRDARQQAEQALREADERARQAREREREAQDRERETRRLLARSRKLTVVLGAVLLAAIALGVLGAWLWRRSEASERRAERALLDSAGRLIEKGRGAQALAYLASIMRSSPQDSSNARSRALDILLHESWPLPLRVVRQERAITAAKLSPDGERLLTTSADGTARLWRVRDGADLVVIRIGVRALAAFSPDGTRVLTTSWDGLMRIWDGRNGARVGREMKAGTALFGATWSPRGDRILTESWQGTRLWDPATQKPLPAALPLGTTAFSPDGKRLLLLTFEGTPEWFDLSSGAGAGELQLTLPGAITLLAFSHRGDRLLSVGLRGTVQVWDVAARRVVSTHEHKAPVSWAEFSPDDQTLLTVCDDRGVRLWNLDDPGQPVSLLQHDKAVIAAHFSPDGRWVLTGSRDGAARLWNPRLGELHGQPLLHAAPLAAIGFSRNGRFAVTAADDGSAKIWELRADHYARPQQLPQPVGFAFFGAQARDVIALMRDGTARRWDLATGASTPLAPANREVVSATVLTDGRLATIDFDAVHQTVQVWDGKTGRPMSVAMPFDMRFGIPSVTADGSRLLWMDQAGIGIWDARTGRRIALMPNESGQMSRSSDGHLVLTTSPAGVRIWETGAGRKVGEIIEDHTTSAVFGADGRFVVVSTADHMLRLFETPGGQRAAPPLPIEGGLRGVDVSHDATRMVTIAGGGEAKVSEVESGRLLCRSLMPLPASISADGKRFLGLSPEGLAQVWDVESCQPLGEPLWQPPPSRVGYARFSPDGSRALVLDDKGIARVWDLPETAAADSEPLADLAEAVGGYAVDGNGSAVPVPDQLERLARLRARAAQQGREPAMALRVMHWFFADPAARTLSPFSEIKAPAAASPQ